MKLLQSLALIPIVLPAFAGENNQPAEKYNILFLSCEDIDPSLSCYGTKGISTPNIDRLANEGIRYTNAYAAVGVSGASRSSIITGMYPISIGTMYFRNGPHGQYRSPENETYKSKSTYLAKDRLGRIIPEYSAVIPDYIKCFTEYMRAAGYYCTNNNKCDYQFNCPISAWDEVGKDADYINRPTGMPFFSVFNDIVSHESQIWLKAKDPMLVNPDSIVIPAYYPDLKVVRTDVARKYSNIVELDKHIGEMLDRLEKEGLMEKTIIFFWSDHGGPLLRQKRAVGNSGLHVPLIVRFPGKKYAGKIENRIVSLMDLGPTVLSLSSIKPPMYMQASAFLGKYNAAPRKYHFGSADRFDESTDRCRSVLDGRFVYIKNFYPELPLIYRNSYREQIEMTKTLHEMNAKNELSGDAAYIWMKTKPIEELYDLTTDPFEIHNLASKPEFQSKLKELRKALNGWLAKVGDKGAIPEVDMIESMWPGLMQPSTLPVQFSNDKKGNLILSCPTRGASIVYQRGKEIGGDHWELYSKPIQSVEKEKYIARAVRIGFKTSIITNK